MGHRLDIASGKNEFDRRLGNFRVQIKRGDEGDRKANLTSAVACGALGMAGRMTA
jgi:hypothetical protein